MSFLQMEFQAFEVMNIFTYKRSAFTEKDFFQEKINQNKETITYSVVLLQNISNLIFCLDYSDYKEHIEENSD